MSQDIVKELTDIAQKMVELARKAGADDAEVVVADGSELTAKIRMGEPELVKEAGSRALGLRVFVDKRAANTHTSDFSAQSLAAFASETVALAKLAEPDELNTLPDERATEFPDLQLWDENVLAVDAETAMAIAGRCEAAARKADKRVTNSEGATYSRTAGASAFANSDGFAAGYRGTSAGFYVQPICDDDDGKKRNGVWWTSHRFLEGLDDPEAVGIRATERTVAKLGARKVKTCEAPVVFEPESGRALLGALYSVANGGAFYRKSSFLIGKEGQAIASKLVTIDDDPLIKRAPGSRPFDDEGLTSRKNSILEAGVLRTVLCDTYSARKLGRKATGSAGRGVGGGPGTTTSNFIMRAGQTPADDIVKQIKSGLFVTSMMGFGFNPVTGDFSRGAAGFWIENGELAFPVGEITISANFGDLLMDIDAVGDDLDMRSSTACPTFRVAKMTIAGT